MDLVDLLMEASIESRDNDLVVRLGHNALDAYFDDLQQRFLPGWGGQRMVLASLNFAMQQLATRSRNPERRASERYLQLGGFEAMDLAAAMAGAMPHTIVDWVPGFTDTNAEMVHEAVEATRVLLPADAMPRDVTIADVDWQDLLPLAGNFGVIALFSDRRTPDLEACVAGLRSMVNVGGRVVVFESLSGGRRPTNFADPDFAGRYLMGGEPPLRTLCISILPATREASA